MIKAAAEKYNIPAYLLAGVAHIEVGGDPAIFDDGQLVVSGGAGDLATSVGPLSINLGTAAETLGYDPTKLTAQQKSYLLTSLRDPEQAIFLAARHLSQLRDRNMSGRGAGQLTSEDVARLGAMYNGGPNGWSIPAARDYGATVNNMRPHLEGLLN